MSSHIVQSSLWSLSFRLCKQFIAFLESLGGLSLKESYPVQSEPNLSNVETVFR